MSKKIGIALVFLGRIVGWVFGSIAVLVAVLAMVVAAPFILIGSSLMGEGVHFNRAGIKEMALDIWENFR